VISRQRARDVLVFIGRNSKRMAVAVLGAVLVVAGLAMLVLPGPGLLVVVAGLAVLATEFVWAERMLDYTKDRASTAGDALRRRVRRSPG
jgi:uncharacterized protein (TIGR02611 family)